MSTFEEIREIPEKYKKYGDQLRKIFKENEIDGIQSLVSKYRGDAAFKEDWMLFWSAMAKEDGGKITLTTMGIIIGAALGGVGIAAMGGAIGIPLAFILGLSGFVGGSKFDSLLVFGSEKNISTKISKHSYETLEHKANELGIPIKEYARTILEIEASIQ